MMLDPPDYGLAKCWSKPSALVRSGRLFHVRLLTVPCRCLTLPACIQTTPSWPSRDRRHPSTARLMCAPRASWFTANRVRWTAAVARLDPGTQEAWRFRVTKTNTDSLRLCVQAAHFTGDETKRLFPGRIRSTRLDESLQPRRQVEGFARMGIPQFTLLRRPLGPYRPLMGSARASLCLGLVSGSFNLNWGTRYHWVWVARRCRFKPLLFPNPGRDVTPLSSRAWFAWSEVGRRLRRRREQISRPSSSVPA